MAKDETEIGITGLPIPKKKRSPAKQYKFEKQRRENIGPNVGGVPIKKDVTPYYNPHQRTFEEFMNIAEGKVDPNEKLPSGKTPLEKMERAQGRHGANYMLSSGRGRNNPARDSHFSRGRKVQKIKDIVKSGEDPRNSAQAGVGWGNDARKIGRPGVSTADRTSRTKRTDDDDAKTVYTQGGLRAHKTKAGGYRTLKRP